MNLWFLILFGLVFIVIGFIIIVIGSLHQTEHNKDRTEHEKPPPNTSNSTIKGGGVIMIGPIPIIFGSDYKYAIIAILLAIILLIITLKLRI